MPMNEKGEWKNPEITQNELKSLFTYNQDTGVFTKNNILSPIKTVGYVYKQKGFKTLRTRIGNKNYLLHKLAWLYVFGDFPKGWIVHVDGDGLNNKISNLMLVKTRRNNLYKPNCNQLTQNSLKEVINYDEESGKLTWLKKLSIANKVGDECGCLCTGLNGKSYRRVNVFGKSYFSHHLAWLYMTGGMPKNQIDHINGDGTDNRFINLRDVSPKENSKNKRRYSTNKTGISGVSWSSSKKKYRVEISTDGKTYSKDNIDNLFDAACLRKNYEFKYGFHKNHGKDRQL